MFERSTYQPRRAREFITVDANDPAAYDEHGILKDGYRIRISMTAMDAAPPQRSAPRVISTGLVGEHALKRFFYSDGTPKKPRHVRDHEREQQKRTDDAVKVAVAFDAQYNGNNRPGFRFADTTDVADAA